MSSNDDVDSSILPSVVGSMIGLATVLCYMYYVGLSLHHRQHRRASRSRSTDDDGVGDKNNVVQVELLEIEKWFHLYGASPTTTLTWYRGDCQAAREILTSRLQQILEVNTWLGGRVKRRGIILGKVCLVYNRTAENLRATDFITTLSSSTSPISRTTPLAELAPNCRHLMLGSGPPPARQQQPLFRLSLVPCRSNPSRHFALIFAVSHVVADGFTYFRLLSMLCGNRTVQALTPQRILSSPRQQAAAMGGRDHYNVIGTWNVGLIVNGILALLRSLTVGPVNTSRFAEVAVGGMDAEKKRAAAATTTTTVPFVSTNDVLTSWFLQNTSCKFGFMAFNWRNRLEGHTEQHAGNYENCIFYRKPDSFSASLIRESLAAFQRTQTLDSHTVPGILEMAFSTMAVVSNWQSLTEPLGIQDCEQEFHMPLYTAMRSDNPTSLALLIIFQATPEKLGLFMIGTPDKLRGLGNPSFLCRNSFE